MCHIWGKCNLMDSELASYVSDFSSHIPLCWCLLWHRSVPSGDTCGFSHFRGNMTLVDGLCLKSAEQSQPQQVILPGAPCPHSTSTQPTPNESQFQCHHCCDGGGRGGFPPRACTGFSGQPCNPTASYIYFCHSPQHIILQPIICL